MQILVLAEISAGVGGGGEGWNFVLIHDTIQPGLKY